MTCPGLVTHTIAGLCALWLPSCASKSGTLQDSAKPPPPKNKPPARSCRSTQCRLRSTCRTLQRLHWSLQLWPMACPVLATHTLARLYALWLPSGASTPATLQHSAKPHSPQTTCTARPQHPVLALQHLKQTAEAAFDLAVVHSMPRAGHSHTSRALSTVVAEWRLHIWNTPAFSKTAASTNHLPSPATAPSAGSIKHTCCTLKRLHLILQWPMVCPGLATHPLVALCAL